MPQTGILLTIERIWKESVGDLDGYHIILFFVFFCGNVNIVLYHSGEAAVGAAARVQRGLLPSERQWSADPVPGSVGNGMLHGNQTAFGLSCTRSKEAQSDSSYDNPGEYRNPGGS